VTDFHNERTRLSELEALVRQGKLEEAVALGLELVEDYPDSFMIRLHLARALKESNALLRAESILSVLDSRYGDNITFLIERGDLLRRLGRLGEAQKDYEKILFLDPFNNKVKRALEEVQAEVAEHKDVAYEVVDYSSEAFRDDQTVPELILNTESKSDFVSYEPIIDLDAEPENEQFFNPVSSDQEEIPSPVGLTDDDGGWIQIDISPPPEPEAMIETPPSGYETGFVTESAARLYAQQGLYNEALSIYERLGKMATEDKYRRQTDLIKSRIVAERQLDYFQKMLSHLTIDRGPYFV